MGEKSVHYNVILPYTILQTTKEELQKFDVGKIANVAYIKGEIPIKKFPEHWHQGLEIIYSRGVALLINVNGVDHVIRQGEFILINSLCVHSIEKLPGEENDALSITFHDKIPDFVYQKKDGFWPEFKMYQKDDVEYAEMIHLFEQIIEQKKQNHLCKNLKIQQYLYEILSMLFSSFALLQEKNHKEGAVNSDFKEFVSFMHTYHTENITTQILADKMGYSREHFCRYFKKETGVSSKQYLNLMRLAYVTKELKETNEHILTIALNHGFSDQKGFLAAFKKYYGILPSEYRQRFTTYHKKEVQLPQIVK